MPGKGRLLLHIPEIPGLERSGEVADDHDVADAPDDPEGQLEALVILDIYQFLVELPDDERFHLLSLDIKDHVLDLSDEHALFGVDIEPE